MVTGIDSFKEWFKGSEEQYAIIGGTACDILMTEEGLDFRATKDIDLVLLGVAVLITYSPQNGFIFLLMAFLISPMGLSLAAIWLLGKVQDLKYAIQDWMYG
mgnify:CR=1 FL=1